MSLRGTEKGPSCVIAGSEVTFIIAAVTFVSASPERAKQSHKKRLGLPRRCAPRNDIFLWDCRASPAVTLSIRLPRSPRSLAMTLPQATLGQFLFFV